MNCCIVQSDEHNLTVSCSQKLHKTTFLTSV
uniref:Uncharacterized protein n=1 Tax=Anguilla anguilla TaxID=7936 RepID=A0A0E9SMT1_ANGAN